MLSNFQSLSMKDDPNKIAKWLIEAHGPEDARRMVLARILKAQDDGDNYGLSVWREVRLILAKQADNTGQLDQKAAKDRA
ncbi:MAG: hypothetical protein O2967_19575 [Proteobacteria bacterium]|nr:hypothetical protein [Pseudomonadota bacterium]